MPVKKFKRTIENFVCAVCGREVVGDGYTNHCPHCLHSKHVDINPGDRASPCHGIMKPIGLEIKNGDYYIIQRCQKCGHTRPNKRSEKDSFETLLKISSKS
ncbi:MAG: RNHCP domain-containing protein [Lactobacillales bacterium]|nr:RNHCP domain-containing protein [Lactobacillales bacterium]